ncbi:MAG: lysophospholipid acyltransferase family protein [Dehalococcoidales bacterium]|nr:lysophospholipid acyltransferase family protein [Dehalococcoidales bacterium]
MGLMLIYHSAELGRKLVRRTPAFITYSLAVLCGDVMYYAWPRGRRNMLKSVANLLNKKTTDPSVKTTARHCMRNYCKYAVDFLRYSYSGKEFFERHFKLQGRENLDAALNEGKGVVLVSFHLGNLDLGVRLLSKLGYPVNAIVDSLSSFQLDIFLQKPRSHSGVRLINVRDASAELLSVLRRNEILALMIDCPNCMKGVRVKLGQKWILLPTGAATLALRTGARLVPCGLVRTSNTTFQGIIGKPVECTLTGKVADDVKELTQNTVKALEEMTMEFLDQWYVFHPLIRDDMLENGPS